jgi:DNA polymerase III subunit gamma/tau
MESGNPTDGPSTGDAVRRSGEYVVIARRYRPQSFDELIGQEHVAKGLAAAIATSRVGHAYLFTGARGTGKTSTARILAKALNCERGPTPTPCNQCDICRSITAGDDMDVLEIDGASNRGIDEIRQLRQNVNVRPSRSRFKIYIIDEVHMLTKEAFNALLKTLEEPPEHVKFIFCTTEPEKIPITILSRCQRFDFAGVQTKQIVQRLKQIAQGEGIEAEPDALEIIARRAAGSMRDSQSLLEQLLAFGSKRISVADVHSLLGTAGAERIARVVQALIERNPAAALTELDRSIAEGVDVGQLLDQLLGYFRDIMAAAVGCPADTFLHVSAAEQPVVDGAAGQLGLETILAILQILDQTISRLKYLMQPRTVAELALVRICNLEDLDALPQLISSLREGDVSQSISASTSRAPSKKNSEPLVTIGQSTNGNGHAAHVLPIASTADEVQTASVDASEAALTPAGHVYAALVGPPIESTAPINDALALWQHAAAQLGGLAAEKAQQATAAAISGLNQLVIMFPKRYNFCRQFCERPEVASQLAEIVSRLAKRQLTVSFELAEEAPATAREGSPPLTQRQKIHQASQRPFVKKALELFDANPVRLEEAV